MMAAVSGFLTGLSGFPLVAICCAFILILLFIAKFFGIGLDLNLVRLNPISRPKLYNSSVSKMAVVNVRNPFEISIKASKLSKPQVQMDEVQLSIKCGRICRMKCFWGVQLLRFLQELQLIPKYGQDNADSAKSQTDIPDVIISDLLHALSCDIDSEQILYPNDDESTNVQCRYPNESQMVRFFEERKTEMKNMEIVALVVVLELQDEEQTDAILNQDIIRLVTALTFNISHIGGNIDWQIVHQCVQTADKEIFTLRKLYSSGVPSTEVNVNPTENQHPNTNDDLCIICHSWPVTRCLIPCRHACLCGICFKRTRQCPVCRQTFQSYFLVLDESNMPIPLPSEDEIQQDTSRHLNDMGLWELIRSVWNAS